MKIFVTGCVGFIGSHLCTRLLHDGHEVLGLDNFDGYYNPALKENHAKMLDEYSGFALARGDIRDGELVQKIIADFASTVEMIAEKMFDSEGLT